MNVPVPNQHLCQRQRSFPIALQDKSETMQVLMPSTAGEVSELLSLTFLSNRAVVSVPIFDRASLTSDSQCATTCARYFLMAGPAPPRSSSPAATPTVTGTACTTTL